MPQERSLKVYSRIFGYLKPYRKQFAAALMCMVIFGASDGAVPFLVKYILDGVFVNQNQELLYLLPVIVICFAVIRALADFAQQFLMSKTGHQIVKDLRNDLNSHLLKLSPGFFVRNSTADILSRLTSDVILVRSLLTDSTSAVIRDFIRIVALICAALYMDPTLAAIAFIAFPIGIYPVYRFGRKMRKLSKKGQDQIGSLSTLMQESIQGTKVVKIFGREQFETERFEEENKRLTGTFVKSERVRALSGPVNEVLASLAISGVILYGGLSVIGGARSQGDFIAFLISVFLLYDPFKKLSRVHNVMQQGVSGAERIFEVLDSVIDITSPSEPVKLSSSNSVVLEKIEFTYPGAERAALSDVSLKVAEGEKVALVGFSGAGKSTLIDLVPRFLDPQQGRVLVGGVDVREADLADLRSRIAVVGQHTFLFNSTIFNNIAYGRDGASKEDVIEAAKAAFALEFIEKLPDGFDTVVGEGGHTLSGGERQRISIARAILKDAPILILDEATASLDNRSERQVQSAIEELERDRTSIVIAHRLSTVQNADRIIVLSEGKIVETGSHVELLKQGGEYSKLYALQFAETKPAAISHEAAAR